MISIRQVQQTLLRELIELGAEHPRREAVWMLEAVTGLSHARLIAHDDRTVLEDEQEMLRHMIDRRRRGEPLQYVLGSAHFFGLAFRVDPNVLIPRPETELLVERALDLVDGGALRPDATVLDIGTGSGCIAVAIKHERPALDVWACDVSPGALAVARDNAERLGVDIRFELRDVTKPDFSAGMPPFDLIVSNPPYVPREEAPSLEPHVRDFEPEAALFVDGDPLLFYREILAHAEILSPGGHVLFEGHIDHIASLQVIAPVYGYDCIEIIRDLSGRDRIAHLRKRDH